VTKIFISYSRKNSDKAEELAQRLSAIQFEPWLDKHELEPGDLWFQRIESQIEQCNAVAIIMTPQSAESPWVMRELLHAIECGKTIYPLSQDGEMFPLCRPYQCAYSITELIQRLKRLKQLLVCYAPEDEQEAVQLKANLEEMGAHLWGGNCLDPEAVTSSQIMLLLITPNSMASPEITKQWTAFDAAKKKIIPLLYQHTPVARCLRDQEPYIDFLYQNHEIAEAQLCGYLQSLEINLSVDKVIPIPPQPPLPLDRQDMFGAAQRELWISGLTLDIFARGETVLRDTLRNKPNLHIRMLTLKLDVNLANEVGAWVGVNRRLAEELSYNEGFEEWVACQSHKLTAKGRWVARRLYENQSEVATIQQQYSKRVHIRTISHRLGMGYLIIDPNLGGQAGMLTASPYFFDTDTVRSTLPPRYYTSTIFLAKSSSREIDLWRFEQYVEEFKRLWKRAKPWKPFDCR
jgi:hypothetical protein